MASLGHQRYGQCHDCENPFVAGSGLFPTGGAVNPTFTIHAVVLRTADYLEQSWDSLVS